MATHRLIVFKYESELGNAPSHKLFDLAKVDKAGEANPPRSFSDYAVSVGEALDGVTIIEKT